MQVVIAVVTMETIGHPVMVDLEFGLDCDMGLTGIVTNPLIRTKRE